MGIKWYHSYTYNYIENYLHVLDEACALEVYLVATLYPHTCEVVLLIVRYSKSN